MDIQKFRADYLFRKVFPFIGLPVLVHWITLILFLAGVFVLLWLLALCIRTYLLFMQAKNEKFVFLEVTPPAFTEKTAYTTKQLFSVIHNMGSQLSVLERILGKKSLSSFEIVSTRKQGIRYIVRTPSRHSNSLKSNIISYLPYVRVKEVTDYMPEKLENKKTKILEFRLRKHFAFPLAKQNVLNQHDPVAYITGMMTKLLPNELISFQVVISPAKNLNTHVISQKVLRNEDVLAHLSKQSYSLYLSPLIIFLEGVFLLIGLFRSVFLWLIDEITIGSSYKARLQYAYQDELIRSHQRPARVISPFEQAIVQSIQEKVDQSLFEATIRVLIRVDNTEGEKQRIQGIRSSLAPFSVPKYQSFIAKSNLFPFVVDKLRFYSFQKRLLSLFTNTSSTILSVSEVADLYHFPYAETTKTEDLVKVMSPELPTPLTFKNADFDVIFGKNTYGNTETPIGLTDDDRSRHIYMLGQTGSGKTTVIFHIAKDDIQKGRGVAVIDPHGDLAEDLLETVPLERKDDLIYLNPFDLKYPIGINLLELTEGLDEDAMELEKELVTESVISIFRRVFSNDEQSNAHRIEYVLRNTIYTSFSIPDRTIFTIYDLLNNPDYQKKAIKTLTDENLQNFWKYELGRAGNYQIVKMVSGVTAKVGRFLFSPTAKRILEQPKSTINFGEILDSGKILICNLAEGKLGEDTSQLLGTMVLAKIQQAAFRRSQMNIEIRKPFYLYIDEFQNFATSSFTKILSGGRKFGLRITVAEQSTTQQDDRNVTNTILANTGTVICFRTASPIDEDLMLTQFRPLVEKGAIVNLPRFHFYIKLAAVEPQDTFSGKTISPVLMRDQEKLDNLIAASRKNWAIVYKKKVASKIIQTIEKPSIKSDTLPDNE